MGLATASFMGGCEGMPLDICNQFNAKSHMQTISFYRVTTAQDMTEGCSKTIRSSTLGYLSTRLHTEQEKDLLWLFKRTIAKYLIEHFEGPVRQCPVIKRANFNFGPTALYYYPFLILCVILLSCIYSHSKTFLNEATVELCGSVNL